MLVLQTLVESSSSAPLPPALPLYCVRAEPPAMHLHSVESVAAAQYNPIHPPLPQSQLLFQLIMIVSVSLAMMEAAHELLRRCRWQAWCYRSRS